MLVAVICLNAHLCQYLMNFRNHISEYFDQITTTFEKISIIYSKLLVLRLSLISHLKRRYLMLSDLQKRKFTVAFQLYDVDDDGYLERKDFIGFANRVAEAFNPNAPPEVCAQLQTAFEGQWDQTQQLADTDHDDRVSLEEWLRYFDVLANSPEATEAFIQEYIEGTFALYQIVDPAGPADEQPRERYVTWMTVGTQDEASARENFDRIDTDGDGLIPRAEFYTLLREWLGNDPNARGNWVLGPY